MPARRPHTGPPFGCCGCLVLVAMLSGIPLALVAQWMVGR
jgi:hypothetical protein